MRHFYKACLLPLPEGRFTALLIWVGESAKHLPDGPSYSRQQRETIRDGGEGGQKEEKLMLSLTEFAASLCPIRLLGYPGRRSLCGCSELHWLYWFARRAELLGGAGGGAGDQGDALKLGGAAVGTPEQCPTTLDGEGEVLLPWRRMTPLKIGCHGNQFGSLGVPSRPGWSPGHGDGDGHGMDGTAGCSRAELSPRCIPQNELLEGQTGVMQPQTGGPCSPNWSGAGWWGKS